MIQASTNQVDHLGQRQDNSLPIDPAEMDPTEKLGSLNLADRLAAERPVSLERRSYTT